MRQLLFTCICIIAVSNSFAQQKTYWSPEQTMKMKNVSSVRVSPDGKKVVYAVREALMTADRSEFINQLFLADADGKNTIQLTRGDRNNSSPAWSPDGKWIAFLSNRDSKNNIYILPVGGGESERITDVKTGVAQFKWSPDSRSIAYTMTDAVSEAEEKAKKAKDDWYFMNEEVKQGRLYVLSLHEKDSAGKLRQLQLTKENRHISSFDWSPDGKHIVYTHANTPIVNDGVYSDIALVNVATGAIRNIANTKAGESQALFSPDGKYIAYLSTDEDIVWAGKSFIRIVPFEGGRETVLASTPNEPGSIIGWSADGKYIYAYEPHRTGAKIFRLGIDGKSISEWNTGKDFISNVDLNEKGTHFSFVMQNLTRPGDAYVSPAAQFAPVKISTVNPAIADYPVPRTELVRWKSFDGKEIEGLLTYPLHYETGRKYPLLLNIHGGPAGVFGETFIAGNQSIYPIAAMAEQGFFILRPNPRGSTGYGVDFRLANLRDWGGGDYQDLMTGVDHVIAKGLVDSTRMGVMGWSYGGFMSSWIVGHTTRFKAASIGAPVVDLASQNMTDDVQGLLPMYMKKQPWEDWDVYSNLSPLRYVQNVSTPVLLQHGEADIRVPFNQGVMFYNALRRRGVPVRFLVLPRQPHGPTEPRMLLKSAQTNIEWMQQHIMGKARAF